MENDSEIAASSTNDVDPFVTHLMKMADIRCLKAERPESVFANDLLGNDPGNICRSYPHAFRLMLRTLLMRHTMISRVDKRTTSP